MKIIPEKKYLGHYGKMFYNHSLYFFHRYKNIRSNVLSRRKHLWCSPPSEILQRTKHKISDASPFATNWDGCCQQHEPVRREDAPYSRKWLPLIRIHDYWKVRCHPTCRNSNSCVAGREKVRDLNRKLLSCSQMIPGWCRIERRIEFSLRNYR